MKKPKTFYHLIFLLWAVNLSAQSPIDAYIQEGLESNLALQQLQDDYNQSLYALKSARALFFPDVGINARYTVANGGREIEFPVGDLMNPVYSTLNQLTQSSTFPQVENEIFPFYRPTEHETKLSLTQPVFSPKVYYNYQIAKEKSAIEKVDIAIYQRELIKEIKTAYYTYQKTECLVNLVDETLLLLEENIRVSKRLFENDKVTSDVMYRSEAELQNVLLKQVEAEKSEQAARSYFNFLLNRPLTDSIVWVEKDWITDQPFLFLNEAYRPGIAASREELEQLEQYKSLNNTYQKLTRANNYPTIALAMDYGYQGEEYSFTAEDDFMMASLVLRWNLFHGMKNRADIQKAKIAQHQLEVKQQEVRQQLDLQALTAYNDLKAAVKAVEAAKAEVLALEKAFEVVKKKYRNGQVQLIEYIDARTAMTTSKQNMIIALFEVKIKEAEYERAISAYPF